MQKDLFWWPDAFYNQLETSAQNVLFLSYLYKYLECVIKFEM